MTETPSLLTRRIAHSGCDTGRMPPACSRIAMAVFFSLGFLIILFALIGMCVKRSGWLTWYVCDRSPTRVARLPTLHTQIVPDLPLR